MRSQLGETFRILGLSGRVVSRAEGSVFIEFDGGGSLCVIAPSEGSYDYVMTMSGPDWVMTPLSIPIVKTEVCAFLNLDATARIAIHLSAQIRFISSDEHPQGGQQTGSRNEPYVAQPVYDYGTTNYAATRKESDVKRLALLAKTHFDSASEEDLYCVPRRYDLSSMFAISVAYALLFSILRGLSVPPTGIFLTGIFFAVVGAAQAILFEGKKPREASIIAGGVAGFIGVIVYAVVEVGMSPSTIISASMCSLVWCPLAGYFAGTSIGGIWLTADYLRKWSEARKEQTERTANSDDRVRHVLDD